ncbi:MAG: Na+/H+ antiporter NhaC family protein [Alloprevotella sp.]|nr:Na+/H+ antiporter NhaC family protein [Alloprevotella sp.]
MPRIIAQKRNGLFALSPMLMMVIAFIGLSFLCGGFSRVPILIVFLITSAYSLLTLRGKSTEERIAIFSRGAGEENLLLMVWIFILAGGFASAAESMGATGAMVDLCLHLLPADFLLPGMFVAACFVSLSVGTSVGTIVALVPIAAAIAEPTGLRPELFVGAVVGGAFFGDNLSFISDTTVVATRSQGCRMSDKFRMNLRVAMPAALLALIIFYMMGREAVPASLPEAHYSFFYVLPYLAVLVTALMGVNVILALTLGIVLTGCCGLMVDGYDVAEWFEAICKGIGNMSELVMVSLMAGGIFAVIRRGGGITWLLRQLTKHVSTPRGANLSIAALVSLTNLYTANNTIAILSVGNIARDITTRFSLDPRRTASLLDIFSCVVQSLIPYGAQLLIAGGLAGMEPVSLVPYVCYPTILGLLTVFFMALPRKKA